MRWPSARIVNSAPMVFRTYPSDVDYRPPSRTVFTIAASKHGRGWSAAQSEGFWRDFVEIDLSDAGAVLQFVHRRGDPDGLLDVGAETHTGHWNNHLALLLTAARAWEPADVDGVSRLTADPQRLGQADYLLIKNELAFPILKDLEVIPAPTGPGMALRPRTLITFMLASAVSALQRRVSMRRCRHCQSWFEATRSDIRFCSASCRATHHKAEKEISHGERAKEGGKERSNLAKPMARAGKERPRPAADKKPRQRQGRARTRLQDGAGSRAPRRR
jgi:hypothetical protein